MAMTQSTDPPSRPTQRNPLVIFLLPTALILAAPPLGNFLGQTAFRLAPTAAIIAGLGIMFVFLQQMTRELNSVTGGRLVGWHFLIPVYGIYWAAIVLPKEMAAAKQAAGKPPPRSIVASLFVCLYAFASDLNDLA